jgi:hypothetical protein
MHINKIGISAFVPLLGTTAGQDGILEKWNNGLRISPTIQFLIKTNVKINLIHCKISIFFQGNNVNGRM